MPDQTEPRVWRVGDTIPDDVRAVVHLGEPQEDPHGRGHDWIRKEVPVWKGPWGYALQENILLRDHGPVREWRDDEDDETRDKTTSTAPMPAEDGNASERPNAGQHGGLYAESTDSIYVRDPANGLWIPWERSDSEAILDEELPDDAVPLHGEQHNVNDLREIDRQKSRADAAEAKLAEVLAVIDSFDPNDWSNPAFAFDARRNFARIRKIVNPEAGQ